MEYTSSIPGHWVDAMLGSQMSSAPGGVLWLRQVHIHAHEHASTVVLSRMRGGVETALFNLDPWCGYGRCQRFFQMSPPAELRRNDTLIIKCAMSNLKEHFPLSFGMNEAMDMCVLLLLTTHYPLQRSDGHVRAATAYYPLLTTQKRWTCACCYCLLPTTYYTKAMGMCVLLLLTTHYLLHKSDGHVRAATA